MFVPPMWAQIFAESLLKGAAKLGIKLKMCPWREGDCIFISIEPSINYSQASSDNLNITGLDYHEGEQIPEEIVLRTEVGYRNYWYNEHLFPKLLANKKLRDAIVDHYSPCHFERAVRINRNNFFCHKNYPGTYKGFEDYLRDVMLSGIYCRNLTLSDCRAKFQSLGDNDAIARLSNWSGNTYNWLEYLKIATPPLNFRKILAQDPATIAEFEKQIEIHLTGMMLIDKIYRA